MTRDPTPDVEAPPLSLLLLGIVAAADAIEAVAPDDPESRAPRLAAGAPIVQLLLGVLAVRERLELLLPPTPPDDASRDRAPLRGILR